MAWNITVSDTHIIKPNLISHFQFGLNRYTSSQCSGALPDNLLQATGWDKVYLAEPGRQPDALQFNFVNFGSPNANYSSQTFGVITSAGSSRDIQFSRKLSF